MKSSTTGPNQKSTNTAKSQAKLTRTSLPKTRSFTKNQKETSCGDSVPQPKNNSAQEEAAMRSKHRSSTELSTTNTSLNPPLKITLNLQKAKELPKTVSSTVDSTKTTCPILITNKTQTATREKAGASAPKKTVAFANELVRYIQNTSIIMSNLISKQKASKPAVHQPEAKSPQKKVLNSTTKTHETPKDPGTNQPITYQEIDSSTNHLKKKQTVLVTSQGYIFDEKVKTI